MVNDIDKTNLTPPYTPTSTDIAEAVSCGPGGPSPDDLKSAPILSNWYVDVTDKIPNFDGKNNELPLVRLSGDVAGHPFLADQFVHTSRLLAIDPDLNWARTASRWYQLGADAMSFDSIVARESFLDGLQRLTAVYRKLLRAQPSDLE